jgi:hypothetical protein
VVFLGRVDAAKRRREGSRLAVAWPGKVWGPLPAPPRDEALGCLPGFSPPALRGLIGDKSRGLPHVPVDQVLSRSKKPRILRRLLGALASAVLLSIPLASLLATPSSNLQQSALKHRQKVERKQLKQQQAAMKRVMAQHQQSTASWQRFKHDMKMQRQLLRERQKEETRRLKVSRQGQKTGRAKF